MPSPPGDSRSRRAIRNLVTRADGKLVNVARKPGHLFVCAHGCCCGDTDRGLAPVLVDLYHTEWERRRLRPHVHLSIGGCLGPCPLANVAMLLFDGRSIWFHSLNTERAVLALYDYIEALVGARVYLPPPPDLADLQFDAFSWESGAGELQPLSPTLDPRLSAGFVFFTHADTDLLALSQVIPRLAPDFPPVRGYNISHLKGEEDARAFVDAVAPGADVVILRLLGGRTSFRGGFERAVERAREDDQWLICLPGTDTLDPELTAASNVGAPIAHEALAYLQLGGLKNVEHLLRFLSDHLLTTGFGYDAPEPQPRHGIYRGTGDRGQGTGDRGQGVGDRGQGDRGQGTGDRGQGIGVRRLAAGPQSPTADPQPLTPSPRPPTLGILFYRSHLLSGNTAFVDAIVEAAERRGARALAVYTSSLQDYEADPGIEAAGPGDRPLPAALRFFVREGRPIIDVLITTTSFAHSGGMREEAIGNRGSDPFVQLGVPVVQAIAASTRREQWTESLRGLSPVDTAMNVAIPELDGRIISVPISFKTGVEFRVSSFEPAAAASALSTQHSALYEPQEDRIDRAVGLALRLAALRHKPNHEKRIAFLLTDYNARASRIAAAVGLDTPASLFRVLLAMGDAGYAVGELPPSGEALLHALIDRGTYDREVLTAEQLARAAAHVAPATYEGWFRELPEANRRAMDAQWGPSPGRHYVDERGNLALAGLEFGNAFVAIQPPRGYGMDPAAIYHRPDLPPPHPYYALYHWLAQPADCGGWGADAIVHVGKHGTLEWLPGKSVGLSADCYPDLFLGEIPLVYPFIINDPGEGAQAKRRSHAVIIDHLTPPMTTAEGYGEVEELSRLVDEYYQLEQLDPTKLPLLQQQIWDLLQRAHLDVDLGQLLNRDSASHTHDWDPQFHPDGVPYTISDMAARDFAHLIDNVNGYLCELTSAQIRDGLHTLGQAPEGEQLIDTLFALVRLPNLEVPSLRAGVASWFGMDLDAILRDLGRRIRGEGTGDRGQGTLVDLERAAGRRLLTHADALEAIDLVGRRLLERLAEADFDPAAIGEVVRTILKSTPSPQLSPPQGGEGGVSIARTLRFVCEEVVPNLRRAQDEITNLLRALDGQHVPAGPSGAPTRGMAQVLPTGRNFYTVDPRALPSAAAWAVGLQLAEELVARYQADQGRYPEWVGISIWGTSLLRTHGDDVAEVMALIGVRPRWQPESRRLIGFEVIPLAELDRPRVDVVCRISGFFRDAFPDLIALLDQAFRAVADLDEPLESNAVRRHVLEARDRLGAAGPAPDDAARRASYRIFGSPPGAYGAGILPLMDERNWHTDADLAEVYVNWGGYAYAADAYGVDARTEFRAALARVEAAVKNQDNREHDIFDSDDYFQYHGGMIAAIRALSGKNPRRYFGDSADPQRAKVRDLKEEALRVFRTRVVNPKWIGSMRRHGYKGALELAATVDYLFGYDATSHVVDDWMYERVARAYALDPEMQDFFRKSNPWALRDMTARLMEAMDRGLWEEPKPEMRKALQGAYLAAEADIEARTPSGQSPEELKGPSLA